MRVNAFIIARMSSKRLPAKNVLPIQGIPMFVHLAKRVAAAKCIDSVVLATSDDISDDYLVHVAAIHNIPTARGSLHDVVKRIAVAAKSMDDDDIIIEILGDNPLVDFKMINDLYNLMITTGAPHASTATTECSLFSNGKDAFPIGVRVRMYKKTELDWCIKNGHQSTDALFDVSLAPNNRQWFLTATNEWSFAAGYSDLNLAVNYHENFLAVQHIFDNLTTRVSLRNVLEYIECVRSYFGAKERHCIC